MSNVLHCFVSQSIFLAHVIQFDNEDKTNSLKTLSTCGYSNIAIISVIIVESIIILLRILIESRKYKKNMLLVESYSAVISAACHALTNDPDASLLPVLWGVVENRDPIGHCCFSSLNVSRPVEGNLYAGVGERVISDPRQDSTQQSVQRLTGRRGGPL